MSLSAEPVQRRKVIRYVIEGYPTGAAVEKNPTGVGGAELQAQRVARLLANEFDMRVLTRQTEGIPAFEILDGVTIDRVRLPGSSSNGGLAADLARVVTRGMHGPHPNVVQGFNLNSITSAAATLARLRFAPFVIKVLGRSNIDRHKESGLGRTKLSVLTTSARRVVVPSPACMRDLLALNVPRHKIEVIPNGVDGSYFRPPDSLERRDARQSFQLTDSDFVFSWVGRLDPIKGLERLAQAWPHAVHICPNARLLIAGVGSQDDIAEKLSLEHPETVRWLGLRADVRPVYWASDMNLITSESEGLSNTLLEGMASGVPAVVSDIPENTDVGRGTDCMLPFRQTSTRALVEAMTTAVGAGDGIEVMSRAAHVRAMSEYELGRTAEKWGQLYQSVMRAA